MMNLRAVREETRAKPARFAVDGGADRCDLLT